MPVSGVRTSWAKAASAASTVPGSFGLVGFAAFRDVFAAGLTARFFVGRFFGDRTLRAGRDLAAMILRPRIEPA
jgi:hypothetical protein